MEVILSLVPIAMILVGFIVRAFWWAVQAGQFEEPERPAHRILIDDDEKSKAAEDDPSEQDHSLKQD